MSRNYKFHNQESIYFISFAVVFWIDVFIRDNYREIIIESLKYCQKEKGLEIYAWCLMPSHMHMIIGTKKEKMEDILRDFKSYTSRKIKHAIRNNPKESRKEWMLWMMKNAGKRNSNNREHQFWQQHNQPIELSDNRMIDQRLDYLHNNPVESGFVISAEQYPYSSARDYADDPGYIEVIKIS